ncbi:hypothetical protein AwPolaro_00520 [Polaromonas sp.]|nr:hypothetical protein AwPolaro_00520 [Polaromonas sp.]
MSYADALADLKADFGKQKLLTPSDIAPYISKSSSAQAALRSREKFPIATKDVGGRIFVSIYDLAHFIGDDDGEEVAPIKQPHKLKQHKPAKHNTTDKNKPTRRPPSLGKTLKLMRARREQLELQLEFQRDLYIELEAIELDRFAKSGSRTAKQPPL